MKLLKSNYDNKKTINFLKEEFSKLESTYFPFATTQFIEVDIFVSFKSGTYKVSLTPKSFDSNNLIEINSIAIRSEFENRTEAIKTILKSLKIIN